MFFAQTPTPLELGGWLLCAATVVSMLNNGSRLLDRIKGKPPAEQLELTGNLLAKRVEVVEEALKSVTHEQDDRRRAIYQELTKLKDAMNESFLQISKEVAGLGKNSDLTNARLVQMDAKLDRINERNQKHDHGY